jgi:c-di-GMP-binding flagellar brake protein YcgR
MSNPSGSRPFDRRRQFTRVPIRMSAEVHLDGEVFTATTRDLSEGGVGIELRESLPEGKEVTLGLYLVVDDVEDERAPALWVKGRVTWTAEIDNARYTAGIRFEVITEEQKAWVGQVTGHLG